MGCYWCKNGTVCPWQTNHLLRWSWNCQQYTLQRLSAFSSLSPQSVSLKNFLYFFLKKPALKNFLYFLKRKFFLDFWKWNPALFSLSSKKLKNPPQGNFSWGKLFLCFKKQNFLIFQETATLKNFLYFRK